MWKNVKLGDVCTITNGSTPLRKEKRYWEEGNVPWFTIDDFRVQGKNITYTQQNVTQAAVDDKKVRLVPANSILLCCTASIGEAAIARVEMATNQQFNALTPKSVALNSDYLYFVATTLTQTLLSVSGSTTINFISMGKLKEISIPLPPLAEQQRIVAKLDATFAEIDAAITLVKETTAQSSQVYQNELSKIFKNIEDCEPRRTLKDVAKEFGRGKSKHRPRNDERLYGDKIPFIQTGNVSNAKMYVDSFDKSYSEFGISQSKIWGKGTVCITIAANIAELAILDIDACFPDSVIGVYPDKEITSSEYIFYLLSFFQIYIKSKSKGSAQQNINLATFEYETFPFPSNLANQNQIVDKLNKLQQELGLYQSLQSEKLHEMRNLKSAILAQELQSEAA